MRDSDVGVIIASYDRVDDARASLEIFRQVWPRETRFEHLPVVHAFNGLTHWWPAPYLEDRLVAVPRQRTHFSGAASLLDAGVAEMRQAFPSVRHAVVLAGDVWLYSPRWVGEVVDEMRATGQRLCTARWRITPDVDRLSTSSGASGLLPTDGLACDFFIVDLAWACTWRLFPLEYATFLQRFAPLLNYAQEMPFLERHLAGKFLGAVREEMASAASSKDPWGSAGPRRADRCLRVMHERPIDPDGCTAPSHKGHWPQIGLVTAEDPRAKRQVLSQRPELRGPTLDRLREEQDTSWWNAASSRHP